MTVESTANRISVLWQRWLLVTLAFLCCTTAVAAADRKILGIVNGLPLNSQTAPEFSNKVRELRDKAAKHGAVRIIVGLSVAFAPEGTLTENDKGKQRKDIAGMQDALLALIPTLKHVKRYESIPFVNVTVNATELELILAMPEITSIQEDRPSPISLGYSVPLIYGGTPWSGGYGGSGQAVAVLDTGVDKNHPFLTGKVVSEACFSTNYSDPNQVVTSVCPGGVTGSTVSGSALPCSPQSACKHGTHVAGIVAGKSNVDFLATGGVAKDAQIIAIQVFSNVVSGVDCPASAPCVLSYTSDQISGLEHVYTLRTTYSIASVNMSLGGGGYLTQSKCDGDNISEKAAIDNLRSVGIATVISSGNEGNTAAISAPGCISSAISVGATSAKVTNNTCLGSIDSVSCYSNSASFLNFLAPGSSIYSSIPGTGYEYLSGTSMAAPHVAGAWAVLKQKKPSASVSEIKDILEFTGMPILDTRNSIVTKRIDLRQAINTIGANYPLTVSLGSFPGITVTSSPAGINCSTGATCTASFPYGTSVALTVSGRGYGTYESYQGACVGFGPCIVTMSGPLSVSVVVTYGPPQYSLTVLKSGNGTGVVKDSFPGINCGAVCTAQYFGGQIPTLNATPAAGSVFNGWSGGTCVGTDACSFNIVTPTTISATFTLASGSGPGVISNLADSSAALKYFTIPVPAGSSNLVIKISGGTGDADLYVRKGSLPTLSLYDCRPYLAGNEEICSFPAPSVDTYYVMLNAYATYSGVTLMMNYTSASGADINNIIDLLLLN
jgi:subtilisin family serine protease